MTEPTAVARYAHPQGKIVTVYSNGALHTTKNGKKASTSATAEKLAAGYGGWVRIALDADDDAVAATAATISLPASRTAPDLVLVPMRVKETPVSTLGEFITDDAYALQQKIDGIRGMLVLQPGKAPWFRNSSGGVMASAVAIATTGRILAALPATMDESAPGIAVDGEVLDGVFYAFDLVTDGNESAPLSHRLDALAAWYDSIVATDLGDRVALLPTARTDQEKSALAKAVKESGGEGWIAKRLDSPYNYGARVTHSLKLKVTHTAEVVVMDRDRGAENFVLGVYKDGVLTECGTASAIGKPNVPAGTILEVKYLYLGNGGSLTQPSVLRVRDDRTPESCTDEQFRMAGKSVVDLVAV